MLTSFKCPCGNNDVSKTHTHDGSFGYEAIVCLECGRFTDHTGMNPANDWSRQILDSENANKNPLALDEGRSLSDYIDIESSGSNGPLERDSTMFEYELCQSVLIKCMNVITALTEQVEEYSDNEHVIGKTSEFKIEDIKKFVGN
jgi:hypothetical protein